MVDSTPAAVFVERRTGYGIAVEPHLEHKSYAPESVRCVVITVSDSRTPETDTSGQAIQEQLGNAGHEVAAYHLVKDEPAQIGALIERYTWNPEVQAIIITGGTGLSPRDSTFETVRQLLDKELPGFGELFRMLSYHEIGSAAMLSRAVAGISRHTVVFSLPGSRNAVQLAMEKLIVPELAHMVGQTKR